MNHGQLLRDACAGAQMAEVAAVLDDPESAPLLDGADRAILAFALRLSRRPREVGEADVEALRAAGLGEDEIVDVIAAAAYRDFANRINFAFGRVDADPEGPPELLAALRRLAGGGG